MNTATIYYKLLIALAIAALSLLNMGFAQYDDLSAQLPQHTHTNESLTANEGLSLLTSTEFDSIHQAVVAAANQYNPISVDEDREFLGAIVLLDGQYRFTVGNGARGQDTVSLRLMLPPTAKVVAFWHTHGDAAPNRRYFSATDAALAKQWQLPFYLADYTGALRVFDPVTDSLRYAIRRMGIQRGGYAKGQRVKGDHGRHVVISS